MTKEGGIADGAAVQVGRPTMSDVARLAGVSQTTVSLVLSGAAKARLAASTRDRVAQAAKSLGYQRAHRLLPGAASTETKVIGFVVNEMTTDPWCALALDGAREKAWEHGYTICTAVTGGDREMEGAVLAQMAALPLLGIIYGRVHTTRVDVPDALRRGRSVLINCYTSDKSLFSIVPGEVAAGHTATDYLIRAGHRRIGFINGEPWMDASRDRLKGYRQSLVTADLPFDPELVRVGNWQPPSGFTCARDLMRLADRPTAIFCANDLMAFGCIDALREQGLSVPDDISVMGFDDREMAQHMRPALTTLLLPHREIGARAAEFLIEGPGVSASKTMQLKVECPLIERESVAWLYSVKPAARVAEGPSGATVAKHARQRH
jgi:LacI family transcriptional regulator